MELRQNSILRISDENTMELIELYEREQCLWNTVSEEYKSRPKRHEAASRIAAALNIKHFTSRYVIIKFKNLRNSYCQELKKIANSVKAGDSPPYRPKVFWFKKMDSFLRPHLQHHTREQKYTTQVSIKSEPLETEGSVQLSNSEDVSVNEPNYSSDSEEFEDDDLLKKRSRTSSTASKRARVEECPESDLTRMMKDISAHLHVMASQQDDCYDTFGRYVSALLRRMPARAALAVQPQLVELLVSATLNHTEENLIKGPYPDPLS